MGVTGDICRAKFQNDRATEWLGNNKLWTNDIFQELKLTHWGRATHICVGSLTIIGSGNGLSPDLRQAITWTSAGIFINWTLKNKFQGIKIHTFSFKKIHLKTSSAKRRPFCLGLNVLRWILEYSILQEKAMGSVQILSQATSHYPNQCWPISPKPYGHNELIWLIYSGNLHNHIKKIAIPSVQMLMPHTIVRTIPKTVEFHKIHQCSVDNNAEIICAIAD